MDPGTNLMRLGRTLEPFEGSDLAMVFGSVGGAAAMRSSLEEIAAPDLVTLMIGADHGLTGTFHGIDGFIDAWADYSATFKELRNRIADLVEVTPDVIYAETRQTGVTATAGIEIDYHAAAIFRFAEGRLQQAEFHLDRDAARRAAGLEPGSR
jgi:ketosteroid isomerase-like protein